MGLREHARKCGLRFGVSCFSLEAVEMMQRVGVDFYKVGSAQFSDREFVAAMAQTGKPVILSTGMSSINEITLAPIWSYVRTDDVTLLQCTSAYPCAPERIGMNVLNDLREHGCKVGLSDHSGTIFPGIIAAYLGADMLEVHVCKSRWDFGPDVPASITIDELKQLVQGVRFAEKMKPVDKDAVASEMAEMRRLFRA